MRSIRRGYFAASGSLVEAQAPPVTLGGSLESRIRLAAFDSSGTNP